MVKTTMVRAPELQAPVSRAYEAQKLPAYVQLESKAVSRGAQEPMYVQLPTSLAGLSTPRAEDLYNTVYKPASADFQKMHASDCRAARSGTVAREDTRLCTQKNISGYFLPSEFLVTWNTKRGYGAKLHIKHPGCVIYVSNMARLGSHSVSALRGHFEQFGDVVDLWLSVADVILNVASTQKLQRPRGVALVILRNKDDASRAIATGQHQIVNGVGIHVRAFNPKSDHPRHQKDWYIAENEVLRMPSVKIDDESDTCDASTADSVTSQSSKTELNL